MCFLNYRTGVLLGMNWIDVVVYNSISMSLISSIYSDWYTVYVLLVIKKIRRKRHDTRLCVVIILVKQYMYFCDETSYYILKRP